MPPAIYEWSDIEDRFDEGLVIGNGASIAVDPGFAYSSLQQKARELDVIPPDVQTIFERIGSIDFELVLQVLWHAQVVNAALGVREQRSSQAYVDLRRALITVVREIHPAYSDVEDDLTRAASFMGRFKMVASLNYDLLAYWAMLIGNDTAEIGPRFKDCWIHSSFRESWRELSTNPEGSQATLVFYPHGNLVLGTNLTGYERKVAAHQTVDLVTTIVSAWESGQILPLFVSEGTSAQKLRAIRRSAYLSTVLDDVLPNLGTSVVIHGCSFSDSDDHILDAICLGSVERFAVSVNRGTPSLYDYCERVTTKLARRQLGDHEVVFYDRSSAGCWIAS